jgi:teichuronic acid biosynthesis glycosyltransferase TuaG
MISILIPIYNGVEFLDESLSSVINQTYTNFEVIIGVNGHEIHSDIWNIIVTKASVDKRIRVRHYLNDENIINKKSASLNQMIKDATYDTICLLDVDDIWLPTKLEKQMEIWKTKIYQVIGTGAIYIGTHNSEINIPTGDISEFNILQVNPIINSSCMISKIDAYWNSDTLVEDYDMWLRLFMLKKKIYNIQEILVKHRIHNSSAFNGKNDMAAHDIRSVWSNRKPVTLVTAYYNIPSKFTNQIYLDWINNFLSIIPCHLYIYTDEESYQILYQMRNPFLDRTKFIIKPFNELYMSERMDTWEQQYIIDHEKYHSKELYIIWNQKTRFVTDAIKDNPFKSDFFFWCDIGSFRSPEHLNKLINFPNPDTVYRLNSNKMYILQINPLGEHEKLKDMNGFPKYDFIYDIRFGGGIFGGHKNIWNIWEEKYYDMLHKFIDNNRFAGKDQNIMASVYVMNPELISLVIPKSYFNNMGNIWFYMQHYLS